MIRTPEGYVKSLNDGRVLYYLGVDALAAQRMAIYAAADWTRFKAIAQRVAGIPGWEGLPEFKDLPEYPPKYNF